MFIITIYYSYISLLQYSFPILNVKFATIIAIIIVDIHFFYKNKNYFTLINACMLITNII